MTAPDLEPWARIRDAVLDIAAAGDDLGDDLASALALAAERLGSVEALLVGRPGSWEADHVRGLAGSASVPDSHMGVWR